MNHALSLIHSHGTQAKIMNKGGSKSKENNHEEEQWKSSRGDPNATSSSSVMRSPHSSSSKLMKSNSDSDSKRGGCCREYIEYSASRTSLAKGYDACRVVQGIRLGLFFKNR